MGNRSSLRAKHDDERQPLASESAEDRVLPRPPRCDTEDFKIDIVPLPNRGVQVVVHDNRKSAPSNQPRDGDIVSLWSVMSNAGDGFLQVTNVKVDPDKDEYVVDMAGTLDADATKFTWQSNFPAISRKSDLPQDVPWFVVTDLDPVILKIRGYQFKQDGDNTWYTITVDGDMVVAKPENSEAPYLPRLSSAAIFNSAPRCVRPKDWTSSTSPRVTPATQELGKNTKKNTPMMTSQMVSFVLIIGAIAITCGAAGLFVTESDQNGVQDPLVSPADETKVALHTYTGEDGIPDTYIVKLRKDVTGQNVADVRDALESELLSSAEGRLTALGRSARVGEVMDFNEVQMVVVEAVKEDIQRLRQKTDMIEAIYQDGVVTTAQICFCPCDCPAEDRPNNKACQTSTNTAGNWGLDRIDQRDAALDGAFNIVGTGSDVNVYILDSGVYAEHEEFLREDGSSRVTYGAKANASWDDNDVMGHGTHLAGIIGGKNVGVAKNANLISVKVLDDFGMGQISGLVSMMYWVWLKVLIYRRKSLLVLSVVSPWNEALNSVVNDLVNFEIMVIAAAGNGNVPTRYVSPASAAQAVAVAASDIGDTRAIFSNYGEEIFLWAPGDMIKSSSPGSPNEYTVRSGTSMASAFVAGAAAAYMSSLDYNPTPQQVKTYLHEQASENVITDSPTEFNCRTELICLRPNFCDAQTVCESVTTTAKFLYVGCSQDEPKKSKKSKKSKKGKKTKKSKKGKNSK